MRDRFKIIENYRDDETLKNEFHIFISKVFPSISFRKWESEGFWIGNYIPFSIVESNNIISNVSAILMDIVISNKKYRGIQIGTVGTLLEYRNKGLSRKLMNYVLDKYKNEVDLFFLFANETVMDFYPKFGFKRVLESIFINETNIPASKYSGRKLDIKDKVDYNLIQNLLIKRYPITKIFGAENYGFITMWHILNLYSNDLYYIEEEDVLIIQQEKTDTLHILDVIYRKSFDMDSVIPKIIESDSLKSIKLYFPPDQLNYHYEKTEKINTGLFILGNLYLPDIPFRFPFTAIT